MGWKLPLLILVLSYFAATFRQQTQAQDDQQTVQQPKTDPSEPGQVAAAAFMVGLSRDSNRDHNSALKFDQVLIDTDNKYDVNKGVFWCPDTGVYVFMWTIHAVRGRATVKLVRDDTDVKYGPMSQESPGDNHSGSSSMSAIVQCASGSAMWLKVVGQPNTAGVEASTHFQARYTSFCGFKLYDQYTLKTSGASALTAELKYNATYDAGDTIKYDAVLMNLGGNYDPLSGVYVCPQDGIYVFSLTGHIGALEDSPRLMINEVEYWGPYLFNTFSVMRDSGTSQLRMVLECRAEDHVRVVMFVNGIQHLAWVTSITSYLLLGKSEKNVAFFASQSHYLMRFNYQSLLYDRVATNIGNSYNPADGRFKCPDEALYLFSWSVSTDKESKGREAETRLVMSDTWGAAAEVKAGPKTSRPLAGTWTDSASTQAIVRCVKGKTVHVQAVVVGDAWVGDQNFPHIWNTFSGFRLPDF